MHDFSQYSSHDNKKVYNKLISQTTAMSSFDDLGFAIGMDRWSFDGSIGSHGCESLKPQLPNLEFSNPLNSPMYPTRWADRSQYDNGCDLRCHGLSPPIGVVCAQTQHPGNFLQQKCSNLTCQEEMANAAQVRVLETATDISAPLFCDNFFTQRHHALDDRAENTTAKLVLDKNGNSPACQHYSRINGVTSHGEAVSETQFLHDQNGDGFYPPMAAAQCYQMCVNPPIASSSQDYYTSHSFRSFSHELCSPDLPLADDGSGIHYQFPISLGLEDCGFDNFLEPIPFELPGNFGNGTGGKEKENTFERNILNLQTNCMQALLSEYGHPSNPTNSKASECGISIKEDPVIATETQVCLERPVTNPSDQHNAPHINPGSRHQTIHMICGNSQESSQCRNSKNEITDVSNGQILEPHFTMSPSWYQGSPNVSSWQPETFSQAAVGSSHDIEPVVPDGCGPQTELLRDSWHGTHPGASPNGCYTIVTDGKYPAVAPTESHVTNSHQSNLLTGQGALMSFIQGNVVSQSDVMKGITNDVIVSAMEHIMQNRPSVNLFPTTRDILENSFQQTSKLLQESISGHCVRPENECVDKENDTESPSPNKKRKATETEDAMSGHLSAQMTSKLMGYPPSHGSVGSQGLPSSNQSPTTSPTTPLDQTPIASLTTSPTPSPTTPQTDSSDSSLSSSSSSKTEKRRPSVLPPCRVCTSKASGLHYGVITCEACNGFFRRSLKRGAIYLCSKDRQCDVKGKRRGECSYCRYQRCLAVGMSKTAVKTGRYSDKTRLAYAIETESQNTHGFPVEDFSRLDTMTSDLIGLHDWHALHSGRVPDQELLERQSKYYDLNSFEAHSVDSVSSSKSPFKDAPGEHNMRTSDDTIEAGLSKILGGFLENWLIHYVKFVKHIPGFNLLPFSDQASLVRATWHEIWLLGAYMGFNSEMKDTANQNSTALHYEEIKMMFGDVYADLSYKLSNKLKTLKVTPEQVVLVKMMCLTSSDRNRLENPDQVRSLHWLVTQCLKRELEKTHPDDPKVFSEIVACLAEFREALHKNLSQGNSFMHKYSLNKETPLCKEILM